MTQYANLPGVVTVLEDGNLLVTSQDIRGDSILIVGTAEDGPQTQPIAVRSVSQIKDIYGRLTQGNLVRGAVEAMISAGGPRDIRCLRYGNGVKASLGLAESAAVATGVYGYSIEDDRTQVQDIFAMEALYAGSLYNSVTIREEYVDGQRSVVVYNPKTALESVFSVDTASSTTDVDVHNLPDLVTAINADSNLNTILVASYQNMQAEYELDIADPASGVFRGTMYALGVTKTPITGMTASGTVTAVSIDLAARCNLPKDPTTLVPSGMVLGYDVTGNNYFNIGSAGNRLLELLDVYEYYEATETLSIAGKTTSDLVYEAAKSTTITTTATILNDEGTSWYTADGAPEAIQVQRNVTVGTADGSTTAFTLSAYVRPGYLNGGSSRTLTAAGDTSEWSEADFLRNGEKYFAVYQTLYGVTTRRDDITIAWTTGTPGTITLTFDTAPLDDAVISVSYDSEGYLLSECATLSACTASADWKSFFTYGKRIVFGSAQPTDIKIIYRTKRSYIPGQDVTISDAENGVITFSNTAKIPDLPYSGSYPNRLHLKYTYEPEWPNITSTAQAMVGGTNGNSMSKSEQYDALDDAYELLENYSADIIVPMETYLDDTKTTYDDETGQAETINAGFATQFSTFLTNLHDNTGEAIGIMGVKRPTSVTLAGIADWVEKLTEISTTDTTRGANIMAALDDHRIQVIAIENVISHNEISTPYLSTCEAMYAGLIASLKPEVATTNKSMSGIYGTRYSLSNAQLDALTGSRYVTQRVGRNGRLVITSGVTAAASGSDYTRLSTVRIVNAALDMVRDAGDPFIGEPNNDRTRAALRTAIDKGLNAMKSAGALQSFRITLISTPTDQILGNVNVTLELVPAFETRRITATVKLRANL